jgi:NADH dehydrogenase
MPTIAIIGGGFAGATLARALIGRLPFNWQTLLIAEESFTTYNPLLPEVIGASLFPEQAVAPLRQVMAVGGNRRLLTGVVTRIDPARRTLCCFTLAGEQELGFDHLVLAMGNRARMDLVPGMAAHALPLKSVGDALHIRNVVLRRLAMMELATDPAEQARLGHFVIIGGGFSGVEVAGALLDCLNGIARFYPLAPRTSLRVTLVHNTGRLLPEMPAALGSAAGAMLARRGAAICLDTAATAIDAAGVALDNGTQLAAATVIATIGTGPSPLAEALASTAGVSLARGRIPVAGDLSVIGLPGLWAIGDCAAVVNARDGQLCPPTAQFAVAQARHLAGVLAGAVRGRSGAAFSHQPRGAMAATGHRQGVARIGRLNLYGLPAWLVWRSYYLLQLPTLARKIRVWLEWTLGMAFPPDITHIQFGRSDGGSSVPESFAAVVSLIASGRLRADQPPPAP